MNKKLTSILLVLCMIVSCVTISNFTTTAASKPVAEVSAQSDLEATGAGYGLASKIEDGNILHCFNWTLGQIKEELPNIAKAGFTSIQTSPLQPHNATGTWYWLYQPTGFSIGNELGSYSDLQSLCSEADKYGIKVIVDVVANHLAGWNDGSWSDSIDPSLRRPEFFHNEGACNNWDKRYDVTHKNIGMPDLNSENEELQGKVVEMLNALKRAGVDGVRWDAAKHIGLPSEGCGFWSKVAGVGMYNYGEILDNPAGNSGDDYNSDLMREYGNYIGITDASYSGTVMGSVRDGNPTQSNGNWANRGVAAERCVYWAESHDTYCNNGWTNGFSENMIDRAYAVVGARAKAQSLYLSRPYEHDHESIMYARKGSTHYTSSEVVAVNHFHNANIGTGENYSVDNGCFVICRGNGAVIVSPKGSNFDITVRNGGGIVKSGTYKDEVSGGTWTVSGDSISGHVGDKGIAVFYDGSATPGGTDPSVSASPASCTYKTDSIQVTLSYSNASSGSYSIDGGSYQSFTNGQTITIGSGASVGTKTTLTVKASKDGTTAEQTYTYTKVDKNQVQTIYFDNNAYNWSQVHVYIYNESGANAEWPGAQMTRGSDNVYYYEVPQQFSSGHVLFCQEKGDDEHRYPADGDPGMDLSGDSMIFGSGNSWATYSGGSPNPPTPTQPQPTQPQPTNPITPGGKVLLGDTDLDNSVTIFDATRIQRHCASLMTLSGDYYAAGDVDKDGIITIFDATCIQRWLAELPTNSYVGQYSDGSGTQNPTTPTTVINPPVPSGSVVLNASVTSTGDEAWYAWTWGSGEGRWIKGDGDASHVVFNNVDSNIIFARVNPGENADWNNGSVWNQTDDLTTQVGGTYTTTGWAANRMVGSWS